jgi:hypothetical protein
VPRRETCLCKDYKECAGNMTKKMRRIPQDKITIIDKQLLARFRELPRLQLNTPTKPQA